MVTLGGIAPSINSNDQRNSQRDIQQLKMIVSLVGSGAQVLGPVIELELMRKDWS